MKMLRILFLVLSVAFFSWNAAAQVVNINAADVETLTTLEGIGEKRAAAIVEYRVKHGAFESVDELIKVKGIGPKTLEKNRDNITVEEPR